MGGVPQPKIPHISNGMLTVKNTEMNQASCVYDLL